MEPWFEVKKSDVIAKLDMKKDRLPWGIHPDEGYSCLVYWEDGMVRMCVDEFYDTEEDTFECLRYYTTIIGPTIEDYNKLTEDELSSKAYSAWCSGSR